MAISVFILPALFFVSLVSGQASHYRTVCYTAGWATYRPDPVTFNPEDIDTSLCTHLIFAFASLDSHGTAVIQDDAPHDAQITVDFINLMTYDNHGAWDTTVGHHSSLYSPTSDPTDSIDYVIHWILNTTVHKDKLNLGLAFYGRAVTLTNPQHTAVGSAITGAAAGGEILKDEEGILAYYEVCKLLNEHASTITESGRLPGTQSPYVVDGSRWTGYDDVQSIQQKVDYVMRMGLGGVFIWTIDMDDFKGICGGGHNPLLHAIHNQYNHPVGR